VPPSTSLPAARRAVVRDQRAFVAAEREGQDGARKIELVLRVRWPQSSANDVAAMRILDRRRVQAPSPRDAP